MPSVPKPAAVPPAKSAADIGDEVRRLLALIPPAPSSPLAAAVAAEITALCGVLVFAVPDWASAVQLVGSIASLAVPQILLVVHAIVSHAHAVKVAAAVQAVAKR